MRTNATVIIFVCLSVNMNVCSHRQTNKLTDEQSNDVCIWLFISNTYLNIFKLKDEFSTGEEDEEETEKKVKTAGKSEYILLIIFKS